MHCRTGLYGGWSVGAVDSLRCWILLPDRLEPVGPGGDLLPDWFYVPGWVSCARWVPSRDFPAANDASFLPDVSCRLLLFWQHHVAGHMHSGVVLPEWLFHSDRLSGRHIRQCNWICCCDRLSAMHCRQLLHKRADFGGLRRRVLVQLRKLSAGSAVGRVRSPRRAMSTGPLLPRRNRRPDPVHKQYGESIFGRCSGIILRPVSCRLYLHPRKPCAVGLPARTILRSQPTSGGLPCRHL